MLNLLFLSALAAGLAALYAWAFRALPRERWQFVATAPSQRRIEGWSGVNFTFYGFFAATAYALGGALYLILAGAAGVGFEAATAFLIALVALCAPASHLLTRLIERKRHGFTVGGAVFVGFFAALLLLLPLGRALGQELPAGPLLAAGMIAYVLGEGVGRLGCISFGCCHGKPVEETSGWVRSLSERFPFVFEGECKKIAFASRLAGRPVAPVQAFTAVVLGATALGATSLYLNGLYGWSIALGGAVSQLWRVYSETLRADFAGVGKGSPFQYMAGAVVIGCAAAPWLLPATAPRPELEAGLRALWAPGALLFLQALWLLIFFYMGRSMQTGAALSFHVHADRV